MFVGIGPICTPLAVLIYKHINAHRDEMERQGLESVGKYNDEEIRAMGDRAPDFRYTL
jgi:hypothetical protein